MSAYQNKNCSPVRQDALPDFAAFLHDVVARYSVAPFNIKYCEVWNEPDLFGGFKLKNPKNYLTMYLYAGRATRDVRDTQPFKFGGPATTDLYRSWFDGFLDFAAGNDLGWIFILGISIPNASPILKRIYLM